ncbi:MAG: DEAD/DEAH box helicase, partial [Nocardioides sp.]
MSAPIIDQLDTLDRPLTSTSDGIPALSDVSLGLSDVSLLLNEVSPGAGDVSLVVSDASPGDGDPGVAGPGVFAEFPDALIAALAEQGITSPTPVQAAVIPDARSGRDVLGRARTGSGKTLAFGLPILARLSGTKSRPCHPRAVIIVPTRELANQVAKAIEPLAGAMHLKMVTIYGGTPYERQTRQLRQKADIVVATPGRLDDLLEQGYCFFDDVEITVLDEADHLCDLGFYPAVDKLVAMTPEGSQRMLLSATLDGDVDALVKAHLREPTLHELDPNAGAVTTMTHHTLVVGGFKEKIDATARLVRANGKSIVFTRTREAAMDLAESLNDQGIDAVDLHGDLSQRVRERNLHKFSNGHVQAVVATDVAARGIHVDSVDLVVHFDAASDPKAYLHRSGRTARAGLTGCVVTITTPKFINQVVRLQQGAGVVVRHHDSRSAPEPMTADALAESGTVGPARTAHAAGAYKGGTTGGYKKPYQGRKAQDKAGAPRARGDRPYVKSGGAQSVGGKTYGGHSSGGKSAGGKT